MKPNFRRAVLLPLGLAPLGLAAAVAMGASRDIKIPPQNTVCQSTGANSFKVVTLKESTGAAANTTLFTLTNGTRLNDHEITGQAINSQGFPMKMTVSTDKNECRVETSDVGNQLIFTLSN
jgi:hypothetical protein